MTTAPPDDDAATRGLESSVLAVVLDPRQPTAWPTLVSAVPSSAAFYHRDHALIYLLCRRLAADGAPIDPASVLDLAQQVPFDALHSEFTAERAADDGLPDRHGPRRPVAREPGIDLGASVAGAIGTDTITTIASTFAVAAGFARNVALLAAAWRRRQVLRDLAAATDAITRPGGRDTCPAIVDQLISTVSSRLALGASSTDLGTGVAKALTAHDSAQAGAPRRGGVFGIHGLDALAELAGGSLWTLAADTGGGKTSLALHAIDATSRARGAGAVALASLEMTDRDLGEVMVARALAVARSDVRHGRLTKAQRAQAGEVQTTVRDWKVSLKDQITGLTVAGFTAWVRLRHRLTAGRLHLVVLDHIGLLNKDHPRVSEYDHLCAASRACKALALELDICVLSLCQLSREGRKASRRASGALGAAPEPQKSDLRGSGSLEQDSDGVLFLWIPEDDPHRPSIATRAIVAKNRSDRQGAVDLLWCRGDGQVFKELRSAQRRPDPEHIAAQADRADRLNREPSDAEGAVW